MIEPRGIRLEAEAVMALTTIIGIMSDQLWNDDFTASARGGRWDPEVLMDLEVRLTSAEPGEPVTLGIDDAALLLDGMAFTEIASAEFPWAEMVRWTSDFVTAELRSHWTDDEWRTYASR
jgi:hypothetical protein